MAAPRKPTNILQLTGALRHDPKRYADRLEAPGSHEPIGEPPETMAWDAAYLWRQMAAGAAPGTLSRADRAVFEMAVTLTLEMQLKGDRMPTARLNALTRILGTLGMTPADRARVRVPKAPPNPPASPFGALLGPKQP